MAFNHNNIKYIKIIYRDNCDISHCAKAAIKNINGREIYASAKVEMPLYIKTPQEISLSIVCEEGLYKTNTTLKFVENKDSYVYFTIDLPDGMEYQQNREYFRVRMAGDVLLRFAGNVIPAKIYDISANGIRLELDKDIKIPESVTLDILLPPKSIKTSAKYIRTDDEDNILKASFFFINLPEASRDIISQKCIQKQLENKRNSII